MITKIIYDVEYYNNVEIYIKQIQNKYKYTIIHYINGCRSKLNTNDENFINELRNKYKLSHKIRNCQFKFKERYIEISRDLFNWREDGRLWGAYNRAYNLDENEIERQYQSFLRSKKFDRILKNN
jgi:hypothetical protein